VDAGQQRRSHSDQIQRQPGQKQLDQRQQNRREYGFSPSSSSSGNWRKENGSKIPTLSGRRQEWRDSQDRSKKWQAKRDASKTGRQEKKVNETSPKKTGITFSTTS